MVRNPRARPLHLRLLTSCVTSPINQPSSRFGPVRTAQRPTCELKVVNKRHSYVNSISCLSGFSQLSL